MDWLGEAFAILMVAIAVIFFLRNRFHLTLSRVQIETASDRLLDQIISQTADKADVVDVETFLKGQGRTRRDREEIASHLVEGGFVKPDQDYKTYVLTDTGWLVKQERLMGPRLSINQDFSGTSGVVHGGNLNVGSPGATNMGDATSASGRAEIYSHLAQALRADAQSANQREREAAENCAREIEESSTMQDDERSARAVERVRGILETANSAFTLTNEIIGQFFS